MRVPIFSGRLSFGLLSREDFPQKTGERGGFFKLMITNTRDRGIMFSPDIGGASDGEPAIGIH